MSSFESSTTDQIPSVADNPIFSPQVNRFIILGAITGLALTGCSSATESGAGETSGSHISPTSESADPNPLPTDPTGSITMTPPWEKPPCDDPTPEELAATDQILSTVRVEPLNPPDDGEDVTAKLIRIRQETAAQYGLTVYDYRSYYKDYSADFYRKPEDGGSQIPASEYLKMATDFAAMYGITLSMPQTQDKIIPNNYDVPMTPAANLATASPEQENSIKSAALVLVQNLGDLPVEFVRDQAGLTDIQLVTIGDKNIAGLADPIAGNVYYVDPAKKIPGQVFNHELTHLWDGKQCEPAFGMHKDPSYVALNPNGMGMYVGHYPTPADLAKLAPYNSEYAVTMSPQRKEAVDAWSAASLNGDEAATNAAKAALDQLYANVAVAEDYGFTNPAEDKAVLGQDILSTFNYHDGILDSRSPIERSKAEFLLARMYHDDPRIVQYFNTVGNVDWQ